eukprot:gene14130-20089_t
MSAPLVLSPISFPDPLIESGERINVNDKIIDVYVSHVVPGITKPGDDSNYGSSGILDVICLQALSKRVHYGKFVAEAKFLGQKEEYTRLIKARDSAALMELLTDKAVELKVLERVRLKTATFGQDLAAPKGFCHLKVSPDMVTRMYEEWVIPLTKEVEVLPQTLPRFPHEVPHQLPAFLDLERLNSTVERTSQTGSHPPVVPSIDSSSAFNPVGTMEEDGMGDIPLAMQQLMGRSGDVPKPKQVTYAEMKQDIVRVAGSFGKVAADWVDLRKR